MSLYLLVAFAAFAVVATLYQFRRDRLSRQWLAIRLAVVAAGTVAVYAVQVARIVTI